MVACLARVGRNRCCCGYSVFARDCRKAAAPEECWLKMLAARILVRFDLPEYALTSHTDSDTCTFIHYRLRHISSESSLFLLLVPQSFPCGCCCSRGEAGFAAEPALPVRWFTTCGAGFGTSALPDEQETFCLSWECYHSWSSCTQCFARLKTCNSLRLLMRNNIFS